MDIQSLFEDIVVPQPRTDERASYAVRPIPLFPGFQIGCDSSGRACLLIASHSGEGRTRLTPAIKLSNLEAHFGQRCVVQFSEGHTSTETYAVVRCTADDPETTKYFLWICETLVQIVGPEPNTQDLSAAVIRLASMFQRLQGPPSRSVNGLFGELYVIWASSNVANTVSMWRQDVTSRFDFSGSNARLEVKVTTGRVRAHTFSYEQCNPPSGTVPVVASMLIERLNGGVALGTLVNDVIQRLGDNHELIFRFQEGMAQTLGNTLDAALKECFDIKLAAHTLRFFHTTDIPAIRGVLEPGLSAVHFMADLSGCLAASRESLLAGSDELSNMIPLHYVG